MKELLSFSYYIVCFPKVFGLSFLLHTLNFLDDFHKILGSKFTATTMDKWRNSAGVPVFDLVRIGSLAVFLMLFPHSTPP